MLFSGPTHAVANGSASPFPVAEQEVLHCMCTRRPLCPVLYRRTPWWVRALATVTDAAMRAGVHISLRTDAFKCFRWTPGRGVAGSCGSCILTVLRSLQAVFHSGCTSSQSHQQRVRVPLPHNRSHACCCRLVDGSRSSRGAVASRCGFDLLPLRGSEADRLSQTCWPFVCRLGTGVCPGSLPGFHRFVWC